MSVLDEMATDWVKRLCVAQSEYCEKIDLLAVEYERMAADNREASQASRGGEGGLVISLVALPPSVLRKYVGERPSTKYGVVLRLGDELPLKGLAKLCGQMRPEIIADTISLLALGTCMAYEDYATGPLLRAISFISDKLGILAERTRQEVLDAAKARMEKMVAAAGEGKDKN
jgi:hypothetical protein